MTKSKSSKKTDSEKAPELEDTATDETTVNLSDEKPEEAKVLDVEPVNDDINAEEITADRQTEPNSTEPEKTVIVQRTGFFQTIAAGVLAAGAGFLGAQYASQSWPFEPGPSTDPLAVAQAAQDTVTELEDRLLSAESAIAEQAQLAPDLSEVAAQIAEASASITALDARLAELEARPVTDGATSSVDMAEVEGEITGLQEQVASLLAEANLAEESAAAAAQEQLARAALARVMANLETGTPFADALGDVENSADIAIPEILTATAAEGVPALTTLQESFDPAARAALAAARGSASNEDASVGDRLGAFLRARTGARSVEPREGDDPDAVLSRIGASVGAGNIGDALAEVDALPEQARSAMTDWLAQAETRHQALVAADALSQELISN